MITTDINYPTEFPWPTKEGYGFNPVSPLLRTDMENGRAMQRRKFTSVPTMANVSWIFLGDLPAAAFEIWFKETLKDGTEWFNAPLKTPAGEKQYVCRFTDIYQGPTPAGLCAWRFAAVLELWERPLFDSEWWDVLPEYLLEADIFDIAMNHKWPRANP